jgi:MFS family permease
MLGPAIAGLLLTIVSPAVCFLVNAISYVPVIAALLFMRVDEYVPPANQAGPLRELIDGVRYSMGFAPIRAVLLLVGLVSLLGMPYAVLMPIFAAEVLHGGPHTLGLLMTAPGIGALVGTVYLASLKTILGAGVRIAAGAIIFGLGLCIAGLTHNMAVALIGLGCAGLGLIVQLATSNTALQTIVDDDKRGRVMSLYTMAFMGMAPFGSILGGALAHRIGVPATFVIGGAASIVGALLFAMKIPVLRPMVLPIYRRKGIIPEIAEGLQTASGLLRTERR